MENLSQLLEKYRLGKCTEKELEMINFYFHHFELEGNVVPSEKELTEIKADIWSAVQPGKSQIWKLWLKIGIAAAVAVIISSIGLYFNNTTSLLVKPQAAQREIGPGRNAATLILADGRKIKLGDTNLMAVKSDSGNLATASANKLTYATQGLSQEVNTLTTARGEQFTVALPDGTEVWLNSASTLVYETNINAQVQRSVRLQGEAYFQVAKNKNRPFLVQTNNQVIEVLGTHFNVSSYAADGLAATTLLEGAVKVRTNAGAVVILKPGEQAELKAQVLKVRAVNTAYVMSWKDGFFMFDNEELVSVMNKIARWYDVKVIYRSEAVKKETFFGTISKSKTVNKVLEHLALTKTVSFDVEGSIIYVGPPDKH
jgi:hypothetical protein